LVSQAVSKKRINEERENFDEGFCKTVKLRKLLPVISVPEPQSNPDTHKWGVYELVDRDNFTEKSDVHHGSIGNNYAQGLAVSEDAHILKELIEHGSTLPKTAMSIREAIDSALAAGGKKERLLIILSRLPDALGLVRSDPAYKSRYQLKTAVKDKNLEGVYELDGVQVPVVSIFLRGKEKRDAVVVFDFDAVAIELTEYGDEAFLPNSKFRFSVIDPLESEELKQSILKQDPEWLRTVDPELKGRLVGKEVGVRVVERIEIKIKDAKRISVLAVPADDDDGE
jgi:hypothetical protein